jgi:predicted phosphodiesterase
MRLGLISDIHGNLEALQATLGDLDSAGIDRLVCLGDVAGYNTDVEECVGLLRQRDPIWVAGNHDRGVTGHLPPSGFNSTAARAIGWTQARLSDPAMATLRALPLKAAAGSDLVAVHGALHPEIGCELVRLNNDEKRRLSFAALQCHPSGARICAHGHTHQVGVYEMRDGAMRDRTADEVTLRDDAYYIINPGTVGEPRNSEVRATAMILDTDRRTISVRRVPYDRSRTWAKTRRAGLAPRYWFLPTPMRNAIRSATRAVRLHSTLKRLGL